MGRRRRPECEGGQGVEIKTAQQTTYRVWLFRPFLHQTGLKCLNKRDGERRTRAEHDFKGDGLPTSHTVHPRALDRKRAAHSAPLPHGTY